MGDRRNIEMKFEGNPVYFYTHWQGSEMPKKLAAALRFADKEGRLQDEPYLARIIFCELVKGHEYESTGFGIFNDECDPQSPTISVDTSASKVTIKNRSWSYKDFTTLSDKDLAEL